MSSLTITIQLKNLEVCVVVSGETLPCTCFFCLCLVFASISVLWGLESVSGLALFYLVTVLFFLLSLIASFTVLHLNILHSVSSFLIILSVFLFCFSFFLGSGVYCWLNLLAHFSGSW